MPRFHPAGLPDTLAILIRASHGLASPTELTWLRKTLREYYDTLCSQRDREDDSMGLPRLIRPSELEAEASCRRALEDILSFTKSITGSPPPPNSHVADVWLLDHLSSEECTNPIFTFARMRVD